MSYGPEPRPAAELAKAGDETRQALLSAAFREMHLQGFRAASLENILRRTGLTKGALYHHFPNKTALGYAVVDEIIKPWACELMKDLADPTCNPVDTLQRIGREQIQRDTSDDQQLGCPVNNLVHEMAPHDEGFRLRLNEIIEQWRATVADALTRGQRQGTVRPEIEADAVATFVLSAYEGALGMSKASRNAELLEATVRGFAQYIESLRSVDNKSAAA